ncbi:MAG TPA: phosphoribosylglycinamide formyltransferase [Anaerolineales bacterium]|jgi:phosphoribosylglycinamide formyltransferase-1
MTSRLVVLLSGNGSNLQAILDACASGAVRAQVVAVISDQGNAFGLVRAHSAGIDAIHLPRLDSETRRDYDARLAELALTYVPNYIVLAGWMRILSAAFLNHFPSRVINLHPALPGAFPGTHAIQRAYESYGRGEIQQTGIMVHLVPDEGVDDGPVLGTEVVPIHRDDTLESLEARVHEKEHALLVDILKTLTTRNIKWHNGKPFVSLRG